MRSPFTRKRVACAAGVGLVVWGLQYARSDMGDFAVRDAIRQNDPAALQMALDRGGSVRARNARGWTVLMEAASDGARDVVPVLLAHHADVNGSDRHGWNPLMVAVLREQPAIAQTLVLRGARVNAANDDGETPLMLAARTGSPALVRLL